MTLNELVKACQEEGFDPDKEIEFYTGPGDQAFVLSVYKGQTGKQFIDIGYE